MKKKFLSIAVAILAVGMTMTAQTPETDQDNAATVTTCQQGKRTDCKNKAGDCRGKHEGRRMGRKGGKHRQNLFNGIELTADQQKALETMRTEQRAEQQKARQEQQAKDEQARQERQAQMNERVKAILTPEQYVQYEKNVEAARAQREKAMSDSAMVRKGNDMRRGDRHGKPRPMQVKAGSAKASM